MADEKAQPLNDPPKSEDHAGETYTNQVTKMDWHTVAMSPELTHPNAKKPFKLQYALRSGKELAMFVDADDGKQVPNSEVPLLLIHGYLDSLHSYDSLVPLLEHANAVSLTLRGWGQSERPDPSGNDYCPAMYADDINAFAKAVGLKRFHLVGHSMGSIISYTFASMYPDSLASLTLIASSPRLHTKMRQETWCYFKICLGCCCCPCWLGPTAKWQLRKQQGVDDMIARKYITAPRADQIMVETFQASDAAIVRSLKQLAQFNGHPLLSRITAKTLMLWGTADDIFDRKDQDMLLQEIKGSQLKTVDKGTHGLFWSHPRETSVLMNAWFKELGASQ